MAALKGAGNTTVSYAGTALTAYCNQADLAATVNAIDTTDFSSVATENIPGLATWTISMGGMLDTAVEAVLGPAMITPAPATAVIGVAGATYTWTSTAFLGNVTFSSPSPAEGQTWSASLVLSGIPTRA